jgi:hypothetical protein
MIHEKFIPDSAAPALKQYGSEPEAERKRRTNKKVTVILRSESKMFQ